MPRGDRTGPMGMGPMTGRAMGYCAGYPVPGFVNPPFGGAYGRMGGFGRGWRHMYFATGLPGWGRPAWMGGWAPAVPFGQAAEGEAAWLRQQADGLTNALKAIQQRLDELEGAAQGEESTQ